METITTAVDFISLWVNVGIVMLGGGEKLQTVEVKPCRYVQTQPCQVIIYQTEITPSK